MKHNIPTLREDYMFQSQARHDQTLRKLAHLAWEGDHEHVNIHPAWGLVMGAAIAALVLFI